MGLYDNNFAKGTRGVRPTSSVVQIPLEGSNGYSNSSFYDNYLQPVGQGTYDFGYNLQNDPGKILGETSYGSYTDIGNGQFSLEQPGFNSIVSSDSIKGNKDAYNYSVNSQGQGVYLPKNPSGSGGLNFQNLLGLGSLATNAYSAFVTAPRALDLQKEYAQINADNTKANLLAQQQSNNQIVKDKNFHIANQNRMSRSKGYKPQTAYLKNFDQVKA